MTSTSGVERAAPTSHDLNCLCGRLVARWVDGTIELRCQRCKRTLRLELDSDGSIAVKSEPTPPGT